MANKQKKSKKQTVKSAGAGVKKTATVARDEKISSRGRIFQGVVTRKFPKRVSIEFERTVKLQKYERFLKKKARIHARLPDAMTHDIHPGDLIKVQECRPLSKIIHFVVIEKVKGKDENGNGGQK